MTNTQYSRKCLIPSTALSAPRFVIFVAGPVIINAAALPRLMPLASHVLMIGIVPPPQTYSGTPTVDAISTPQASFPPNIKVTASCGTYL